MKAAFPEGGAWPTRNQAVLLAAALRSGEAARQAWQTWKHAVDFEAGLDGGSYRLLPLVYRNLSQQGLDDPLLGRLKGVYRLTWYKNQLLFRTLGEILQRLSAAGIPTLLLKGAALTQLYYRDLGLRPMDDTDVLVPEAQLSAALETLTRAGWSPKVLALDKLTAEHRALRPSCGFSDGAGRELDLHWHVLMECCEPGADVDFWSSALPETFEGTATQTLSTTDHLLHICLHGLAPNVVPPVRWIADAMTLLRVAGPQVDWDLLCERAEARGLSLLLHGALHYLQVEQQAPVPATALSRLQAAPATAQQQREYRARTQPVGVLGALPVGWSLYRRQRPPRGPLGELKSLVGFPEYMRVTQGFNTLGGVFTWALGRATSVGLSTLRGQTPGAVSVAVTPVGQTQVK